MTRTEKAFKDFDKPKIKTRNIILIAYGLFIALNVTLAWIGFYLYQQTPDTLLTLVLGVGGIVDVMTALITIFKKE